MGAHAKFAPSGADRWMVCPGSMALEDGLPDDESEYAKEGTRAHEVAEAMLRVELSGNDGAAVAECNALCEAAEVDYPGTGMLEHCRKYVAKVLEYARGHTLLVEQRINFSGFLRVPEDDAFGTSDGVVITSCGEEIQVHDLKYGVGVKVDAWREAPAAHALIDVTTVGDAEPMYVYPTIRKGNRQLMHYALGAFNEFGMLGDFKRVRLVVHQPRIEAEGGYHLSEFDCTVNELLEFGKESAYAALQCQNAITLYRLHGYENVKSYFNPGEKQCRWCKAAALCPALATHVSELVYDDLTAIEDTERVPEPAPLPSDARRLGAKLDAAPLIEHWLKEVRAHGERQAFAGTPPVGIAGAYKLVRGRRGNRTWKDEDAAEQQLKGFRLKRDDMYVAKLISPTAAEELLEKENPRQWKKLQAHITQSEGGISLAPATDKRDAYVPPDPADEIDDLNDEEPQNADGIAIRYLPDEDDDLVGELSDVSGATT